MGLKNHVYKKMLSLSPQFPHMTAIKEYLLLFDGLIITIGSNDDIYLSHFTMINFFFFMGGEDEDIRYIFWMWMIPIQNIFQRVGSDVLSTIPS